MRCCECCCSFRRREDGVPICMAVMRDHREAALRDQALKACNALNRCPRFVPLAAAPGDA